MRTAVILGAGFSNNSGLPVQSKIPELLVNFKNEDEFENVISDILLKFMKDIFGYESIETYPSLDDMFTCIDISTNSGHHLGLNYSPLHLRTVRRLLVYRVYSILDGMFRPDVNVKALLKALFDYSEDLDFIVLNWDTVLERYLMDMEKLNLIDYGAGGRLLKTPDASYKYTGVYKIHGSSNWLYCDNCRSLFYDLLNEISTLKKSGFQQLDTVLYPELNRFKDKLNNEEKCMICNDVVSSHIATFSYRKSFRTNSFANVWNNAENSLSLADKWVFIGYSLPDADYEFKHLLKIAELKLKHLNRKPVIDIVLLNSDKTIDKYKGFFGKDIGYICNEGIQKYTQYLQETN